MYGVTHGRPGPAIKLFQITPYVNDFLISINTQQSRLLTAGLRRRLEIEKLRKSFIHPWWYETYAELSNKSFWMKKNVTFYGVKTYFNLPLLHTFRGQEPSYFRDLPGDWLQQTLLASGGSDCELLFSHMDDISNIRCRTTECGLKTRIIHLTVGLL